MTHTGEALLLLVSLVSCSVLETFSQISPQGLTPEMLLPQLSSTGGLSRKKKKTRKASDLIE